VENVRSRFGKNVRLARDKKGWSQDQLSEKSGLHRTYISGIECGIRNPTIEIVQQLAIALEIELSDLFVCTTKKRRVSDQHS
jgi:transcriptional regulator with XRE-family HTH domain